MLGAGKWQFLSSSLSVNALYTFVNNNSNLGTSMKTTAFWDMALCSFVYEQWNQHTYTIVAVSAGRPEVTVTYIFYHRTFCSCLQKPFPISKLWKQVQRYRVLFVEELLSFTNKFERQSSPALFIYTTLCIHLYIHTHVCGWMWRD
jgi:hypothetical protein